MMDIGIRELKIRAAEVVREVRTRAVRYTITHRGRPVAQLVPLEEAQPTRPVVMQAGGDVGSIQRERAAQALAQIRTIRQKLAGWQADVTQAVVCAHEEET